MGTTKKVEVLRYEPRKLEELELFVEEAVGFGMALLVDGGVLFVAV